MFKVEATIGLSLYSSISLFSSTQLVFFFIRENTKFELQLYGLNTVKEEEMIEKEMQN